MWCRVRHWRNFIEWFCQNSIELYPGDVQKYVKQVKMPSGYFWQNLNVTNEQIFPSHVSENRKCPFHFHSCKDRENERKSASNTLIIANKLHQFCRVSFRAQEHVCPFRSHFKYFKILLKTSSFCKFLYSEELCTDFCTEKSFLILLMLLIFVLTARDERTENREMRKKRQKII